MTISCSESVLSAGSHRAEVRSVHFTGPWAMVGRYGRDNTVSLVALTGAGAPRLLSRLDLGSTSTHTRYIEPNQLLAIGLVVEPESDFSTFAGLRLSRFNFEIPIESSPALLHTRGSIQFPFSERHASFAYEPGNGRITVPVTVCDRDTTGASRPVFSGLFVYSATSNVGLQLLGRVSHPLVDTPTEWGADHYCAISWREGLSPVRRSFWRDDYLYSVSSAAVKVNHEQDLARDVAVVPLTE